MPIAATQAWAEAAATVDAIQRMLVTLELLHSSFVENGQPSPIRAVMDTQVL